MQKKPDGIRGHPRINRSRLFRIAGFGVATLANERQVDHKASAVQQRLEGWRGSNVCRVDGCGRVPETAEFNGRLNWRRGRGGISAANGYVVVGSGIVDRTILSFRHGRRNLMAQLPGVGKLDYGIARATPLIHDE